MNDNDGVVVVRGEIVINDGLVRRTVQFQITPEYGYQQWGEAAGTLGKTMPAVQAMEDALRDAEVWHDPDLDD